MSSDGLISSTDKFPSERALVNRSICTFASMFILLTVISVAAAVDTTPSPATQPAAAPAAQPMWVNHIEPILSKNCFKCHGSLKQKGGLDLRQPQSIFDGGTDGSVVIPGRPGDSPLYQRIQQGAKDHMPPKEEEQLSVEEVSFVQQWIATLPTTPANHPPVGGSGIDWNQSGSAIADGHGHAHEMAGAGGDAAIRCD